MMECNFGMQEFTNFVFGATTKWKPQFYYGYQFRWITVQI